MQIALQFEALSDYLNAAQDTEAALARLVDLACSSVPGCEWSAITERPPRKPPRTVASSADTARVLDRLQDALGEGPNLDAIESSEPVVSNDLHDEQRWPVFCKQALTETPAAAVLSFRLNGPRVSTFALYSGTPEAFDRDAVSTAALFAAHARSLAVTLHTATKAANLAEALTTSRTIGAAVGILMSAHKITDQQAFDLLVAASQHLHMKVRHLAAYVTDTGELPLQRPSVEGG